MACIMQAAATPVRSLTKHQQANAIAAFVALRSFSIASLGSVVQVRSGLSPDPPVAIQKAIYVGHCTWQWPGNEGPERCPPTGGSRTTVLYGFEFLNPGNLRTNLEPFVGEDGFRAVP
jgi:hypothetical protein